MHEHDSPRTRLEQVLAQRHLDDFRQSNEARVLAALGRSADARQAISRATVARELVQFDELDELGGLCTLSRPRQLYYAADAMRWCGRTEAEETQRLAIEAFESYANAPDDERAFGDEAGVNCALAAARIELGSTRLGIPS